MKTYSLFLCAYDGQINSRLLEVLCIDEELARATGQEMMNMLWPDAISTTMVVTEQRLCLDMLEPSMN